MSQYKSRFRVWDIEKRKMLSGKDMAAQNLMIHPNGEGVSSYLVLSKTEFAREDDNGNDYILMLSTGVKDKRGKTIYEDDICKLDGVKNVGIIEWNEDKAMFQVFCEGVLVTADHIGLCNYSPRFFEVLGNIYENPKLMDVK